MFQPKRQSVPKGENASENVGVLDFETDPFLAGRIPFPFAACIYFSADDFALLWESDSRTDFISRVVRALRRLPRCTLYAHNGGRFDFHYLLEYARDEIEIRNGRVTKMRIGDVTLKDSFPLMPFALEEFRKTPIDYAIFEKRRRESPRNRELITNYLIDDCRDLLELVTGFRAIVGDRDTIGSAAFLQMRELGIEIKSMNETHDAMFRPFYFGGRVQAFEKGILNGPFKYLDINSAYPFAMLESHAHGSEYAHGKKLPPKKLLGNCFVRCIARSRGALPLRAEDGSLSFPVAETEYHATGWEILAGIETGTLDVRQVLDVWMPQSFISFKDYVSHFFALRQQAKNSGDKIKRLAYKYLLNSGYGKFAQNPRDFREYRLAPYGKNVPGFDWETDFGDISLWSKPSYKGFGFFDVATGASITGYVRAMLWKAVCRSKRVLYIDTDAMLCAQSSVPMGDALGAWKLEGIAKRAAIAGKKLYGIEWQKPQDGETHRIASKGARLSWSDLLQLCKGEAIIWENDAPTFSIAGAHFVKRRIAAT
jgi:hypothetical protein